MRTTHLKKQKTQKPAKQRNKLKRLDGTRIIRVNNETVGLKPTVLVLSVKKRLPRHTTDMRQPPWGLTLFAWRYLTRTLTVTVFQAEAL